LESILNTDLCIVPYRDGWDVIYEGARYAESHHSTQEEAIAAGTIRARRDNVDMLVFDSEGRVCMRNALNHYLAFKCR
jgi:hypothetical protein